MAKKTINTRIQLKNDTEVNWNKAKASENNPGFIPLLGEAIIYMPENTGGPKIKIGDGVTNVTELPFLEDKDTTYSVADNGGLTLTGTIFQVSQGGITNDMLEGNISVDKLKGSIPNNKLANSKITINAHEINLGESKTLNELGIASSGDIGDINETLNKKIISHDEGQAQGDILVFDSSTKKFKRLPLGSGKFLTQANSALSWGAITEGDIPNISPSKITATNNDDTFDSSVIPKISLTQKVIGVLPIANGGTGLEITQNSSKGVLEFSSSNTTALRIRQITDIADIESFEDYLSRKDSEDHATPPDPEVLVTLKLLNKAIPPMNLSNPIDTANSQYNPSYYAPNSKGRKNSVLISQGDLENNNVGTLPVWLDPNDLNGIASNQHGGALFYGRKIITVEQENNGETIQTQTEVFETQWGTLPVEQGGTGNTTFSSGEVLLGNGTNSITTIRKSSENIASTIVERNAQGNFETNQIKLSQGLVTFENNDNFENNSILNIDNISHLGTFYGKLNSNNLESEIGILKMSRSKDSNIETPIINWYSGKKTNSETLIGKLYWNVSSNDPRAVLENCYSSDNGNAHSDIYKLPKINKTIDADTNFTLLASDENNDFNEYSVLYSKGKFNKIASKPSANGALYAELTNGELKWGTLPVAQGGTGLTTASSINAVVIGNSSTLTGPLQTIATNNGAFYATIANGVPQFGTLPVEQGGTGATTVGNIKAGKDADGNTISSTYLKFSGENGKMTGDIRYQTTANAAELDNGIIDDISASTFLIQDSSERTITSLESRVSTDGTISSHWYIKNYNTAGGQIAQNTISMSMDKEGDVIYTVDNPAAFRNALQLGTNATSSVPYLPLAGGTMTGKIVFNKINNAIAYTGSQATFDMIKFKDNTDDTSGNGIIIGGSGLTCIGGGESADTVAAQYSSGGNENLCLSNDGSIDIYTNCQSGFSSATHVIIDTNGTYIHPHKSVSYIQGANGIGAALYAKKNYNVDAWYPAVALETKGGGAWQIGNYNDETLEFQYATKANRDSNTNSSSEIYMRNGDTGYVLTSGNYSGHTHSYLPLSGGTLTGDLLFSDSGTATRQIRGIAGANDYWRIAGGATASNAGWMEIATADDGNEPIYVRQYTGAYTTVKRTLTLLDGSGNTYFPGSAYFSNKGTNYIGNGPNDAANGVGGALNNLVFNSWYGVSFTTSCTGQTYTNTNAVSINCRNGNVYAARFNGPLTGDVTGNCSGNAANVTGTVAVGHGGTGATSGWAGLKNLGVKVKYIEAISINKYGNQNLGLDCRRYIVLQVMSENSGADKHYIWQPFVAYNTTAWYAHVMVAASSATTATSISNAAGNIYVVYIDCGSVDWTDV